MKLKEKGYIPVAKDGFIIRSGTVSKRAGRYYVSFLVEVPDVIPDPAVRLNPGIGIDLGVKDLAIISDGRVFGNINKTSRLRRLEKQLRRQQRCLSRKYENLKKGESAQKSNIGKQLLRVQKLHQRIENARTDYISKTVNAIVKTKPSYVTVEDLNVSGMMKNKHLSKSVASQKFHKFRNKLKRKCDENGIEMRIVSMWYPSSKTCHACGRIKKDLKLSDRVFICPCGYHADRDYNASLNLRDAEAYSIA